MAVVGYTLFDTAIGRCAIAWNPLGVVAVQLPEASPGQTIRRICEKSAAGAVFLPAPPAMQRAVAAIVGLLQGSGESLAAIALDQSSLSPFYRRIYAAARAIPPGQTLTYGELARQCGAPAAARAVGQAMARNPFPLIVPCHRVMAARPGGGGFSAHGGIDTKARLLRLERAASQQAASGQQLPLR